MQSSDEEDDEYKADETIHLMNVPKIDGARWHHIEDLDSFFIRVYKYHQKRGFKSIFFEGLLQLVRLAFVIFFATFLYSCVDYGILFGDKLPSHHNYTQKVTLADAIYDLDTSLSHIRGSVFMVVILLVAAVYFVIMTSHTLFNLFKYYEIAGFYEKILHIKSEELENLSWFDVQQKLKLVQDELQMCCNSQHINELDIHNRILRRQNYYVAMVNKGLLPPRFSVPFLGETNFWTHGLKFNLDLVFFRGPFAAFEKSYMLNVDYKRTNKRGEIVANLRTFVVCLALANIILLPFIFLWQIIYAACSYVGLIKKNPETFSLRRWSLYGRQYLRHFNELDHKFNYRLSHAYSPANKYMRILTPSVITIFSEHLMFYAQAIFGVTVLLTIVDEDVIKIEHMITLISLCAFAMNLLPGFVVDEYDTSNPEQEMRNIMAHIHYIPHEWRGRCHTAHVRNQFSELFQMKISYITEQLISPFITPLVLLFWLRPRVDEFVKFFNYFTVSMEGVGDVCSFALLDVARHGDPQWNVDDSGEGGDGKSEAQQQKQPQQHQHQQEELKANDGKIELSLVQFHISNPQWRPHRGEQRFLDGLEAQANRDVARLGGGGGNCFEQSLTGSFLHNQFGGFQNPPTMAGGAHRYHQQQLHHHQSQAPQHHLADRNRGGDMQQSSMYHSMMTSMQVDAGGHNMSSSARMNMLAMTPHLLRPAFTRNQMEMSASALYMHELHHQRLAAHTSHKVWETLIEQDMTGSTAESSLMRKQHNFESIRMSPVPAETSQQQLTQEMIFPIANNPADDGYQQNGSAADEDELPPQDFTVNQNHPEV